MELSGLIDGHPPDRWDFRGRARRRSQPDRRTGPRRLDRHCGPPAGYHFVKWTLDSQDDSAANPLVVTNIAQAMTFTAVVAIDSYTLTYTAPAGWYNGMNVCPNGGVATIDSPSPVGCYDITGQVWE